MALTRSGKGEEVAGVIAAAEAKNVSRSNPSQKITVEYLRGLLIQVNISIPPKTRKADLIKMCTESLLFPTESETSEIDATGAIRQDSCDGRVNDPGSDDQSCLLENIPSQYDDVYYLKPNFAPTAIKAPMLRNILCRHNVAYNGKETKADLVGLFNNHIKPKAAATLAAIQAVERSEEGIVDV